MKRAAKQATTDNTTLIDVTPYASSASAAGYSSGSRPLDGRVGGINTKLVLAWVTTQASTTTIPGSPVTEFFDADGLSLGFDIDLPECVRYSVVDNITARMTMDVYVLDPPVGAESFVSRFRRDPGATGNYTSAIMLAYEIVGHVFAAGLWASWYDDFSPYYIPPSATVMRITGSESAGGVVQEQTRMLAIGAAYAPATDLDWSASTSGGSEINQASTTSIVVGGYAYLPVVGADKSFTVQINHDGGHSDSHLLAIEWR